MKTQPKQFLCLFVCLFIILGSTILLISCDSSDNQSQESSSCEGTSSSTEDVKSTESETTENSTTQTEPHVHAWSDWRLIKAATCLDDGEEVRSCECGESEARKIDAIEHIYTSVVTQPNCMNKGYTTYSCSCGDSYVDDYVDFSDHVDENNDHICDVCQRLEPGLYDEENNLVASWYKLVNTYGMDATKDYNENTYTEDESSPYCVFEKNSEELYTSVKLVIGDISDIGSYAFCDVWIIGIESIVISDTVTNISSFAFSGNFCISNITFGNGVKNIGDNAFYDCQQITSIELSEGLVSIGDFAFQNCYALENVTIPDSVINIGENAFQHCNIETATVPAIAISHILGTSNRLSPLKTIVITSGAIEPYCFKMCGSLTTVTILDKVTSIGDNAFENCSGLATVILPDDVIDIGNYVFSGCANLKSINLPEGMKSLTPGLFYSCTGLTDITIPDSVTSIGAFAFHNCRNLTSIIIPEGVTNINAGAFRMCDNLTHITLPDAVTTIGGNAFNGCGKFTSITIPRNVTSIGEGAFGGCMKLVEVYNLSALDITIGSMEHGYVGFFALCIYTSLEEESKLCKNDEGFVFYEGNGKCYLVRYEGTKTEIVLPSDYKGKKYTICDFAFYRDFNLTSIVLGEGIDNIGLSAFRECTSLESIVIPEGITNIQKTFPGCRSLTHITIPKSVKVISVESFVNCINLTSITFNGTVTEWNSIRAASDWNIDVPATEVVCQDGTVKLK